MSGVIPILFCPYQCGLISLQTWRGVVTLRAVRNEFCGWREFPIVVLIVWADIRKGVLSLRLVLALLAPYSSQRLLRFRRFIALFYLRSES